MDELHARERLMAAAIECARRLGLEKTSVGEIAAAAGVTRPTVYAYFSSRDEILGAAILRSGTDFARRLADRIAEFRDPADRVVEGMLLAYREFPGEPALMLLLETDAGRTGASRSLSPRALAIARSVLEPVVATRPDLRRQLDEMAEVMIRFLLSLVSVDGPTHRDDDSLRAFLHRRLVPSLGLNARTRRRS